MMRTEEEIREAIGLMFLGGQRAPNKETGDIYMHCIGVLEWMLGGGEEFSNFLNAVKGLIVKERQR